MTGRRGGWLQREPSHRSDTTWTVLRRVHSAFLPAALPTLSPLSPLPPPSAAPPPPRGNIRPPGSRTPPPSSKAPHTSSPNGAPGRSVLPVSIHTPSVQRRASQPPGSPRPAPHDLPSLPSIDMRAPARARPSSSLARPHHLRMPGPLARTRSELSPAQRQIHPKRPALSTTPPPTHDQTFGKAPFPPPHLSSNPGREAARPPPVKPP
jgi:hypothetical protein